MDFSTSEQGEGAGPTPAVRRPQPRDPRTGAFLPCAAGEAGAATTTGLRAARVPPEYLALQDRFIAGALVDEGERPEDVPTRRRSLIEYRGLLHRQLAQLDAAFREGGLFDKRQRLRVQWLSTLVSLIGRAESVDRLLGLERRQRRVPAAVDDPAEYLAEQEATCERE